MFCNDAAVLQLLMSGQLELYFFHCLLGIIQCLKLVMTWKRCHRSYVCLAPKNCRPLLNRMVIRYILLKFVEKSKCDRSEHVNVFVI